MVSFNIIRNKFYNFRAKKITAPLKSPDHPHKRDKKDHERYVLSTDCKSLLESMKDSNDKVLQEVMGV